MAEAKKSIRDKYPDIDFAKLPQHVAIIMDGNGRWAKARGKPRIFGHRQGAKTVRRITEICAELGIPYLTLYAFSTENWRRPREEVQTLMRLLIEAIQEEIDELDQNDIRLNAIGDIDGLPPATRQALIEGMRRTRDNSRLCLTLALNYSGRWDIVQAAKAIAKKVGDGLVAPNAIDEAYFSKHLSTADMPDPEILIRTSGEYRVSNFLLWQIAYAELFFVPVYWPEFDKSHFIQVLRDFQKRERRFGMISEQIR